MLKSRYLLTLSAGLLASVTMAAGASFAQEQDVLTIRLNADIRSIDPGINRDANTDAVVLHMVEGLVGFRDDASVGPLLAETIDVSEDGRTYAFTLRDGVSFHNGEPLTAQDVLSSWERYTDPDNGWRCLPDVNGEGLSHVTGVEAPDDKTVVFTLEEPNALFLNTLARTDCGGTGIYHSDSVDEDGNWVEPIGTGPFKFESWNTGQSIELSRFDDYAALEGERTGYVGDKTPLVDAVRFLIIPDDAAARTALLSGDVDIIPDVANADVEDFEANGDIEVDQVPGMGLSAYLFQTRDPLFSDVRVRQALAHSLDLAQIATVVSEGTASTSQSVVPSPSPYYGDAQAEPIGRDLDHARELLAEAGYNGEPIQWLTTEHYPELFDMAVLAQAMSAEAGINLQIEVLDWATLLDRYNSGDYTAMSFTYSARLDPTLSFDMMSGNKDDQPRKVWDNPEALDLIAQSTLTTDEGERQAIFDELEAMFRSDLPMLPVYSGTRISAARAGVDGYATWSVGSPRAWGVSISE